MVVTAILRRAWLSPCVFSLLLLVPALASAQIRGPSPGPSGYTTLDCSDAEVRQIHDALGQVLRMRENHASAFQACMQSAPLWEVGNDCHAAATAAGILRVTPLVQIVCQDLPMDPIEGTWVAGQARLNDQGRMDLSHRLLAERSVNEIVGVIVHELMHTGGFDHSRHPFGTANYPLTVPEQAESCARFGRPNMGSPEPIADVEAWRLCQRRAF